MRKKGSRRKERESYQIIIKFFLSGAVPYCPYNTTSLQSIEHMVDN